MKNLLILLPLCLIFTACRKSNDTPAPVDTFAATPAMDGTLNGAPWTAAYAKYGTLIASATPVELNFVGMAQPNKSIVYIRIFDFRGRVGTYDLSLAGKVGWAYYNTDVNNGTTPTDYAKTGTVNIERLLPNDTIQGVYRFVTYSNNTLTGKFSIKFDRE